MNFDMRTIDDSEPILVALDGSFTNYASEDAFSYPTQVKAIHALPFSVSRWQLVPLRPSEKNPPNPTQRFEKILRLPPFFQNVRSTLGDLKLIFSCA